MTTRPTRARANKDLSLSGESFHRVTLTFLLAEEVTPRLFAQKVAMACSQGALRPGEGVLVPRTGLVYIVADKSLHPPFDTKTRRSKIR